jgi:HK97 family phage major capsid protein
VLKRAWPDDVRAALILKSSVPPTDTGVAGIGAVSAQHVMTMLAPAAASTRILSLATKFDLSGLHQIRIPYVPGSGRPSTVYVSESAPMPVTNLSTSGAILTAHQIKVAAALTQELQDGSASTAEGIIAAALAIACEQGTDLLFFSMNAATTSAPAGILNGLSALPAATATGLEAMATDLGTLAKAIAAAGVNSDQMLVATTPEPPSANLNRRTGGPAHYFRYMGVVDTAAGGAAGEITKVSHALTPDARLRASNSP